MCVTQISAIRSKCLGTPSEQAFQTWADSDERMYGANPSYHYWYYWYQNLNNLNCCLICWYYIVPLYLMDNRPHAIVYTFNPLLPIDMCWPDCAIWKTYVRLLIILDEIIRTIIELWDSPIVKFQTITLGSGSSCWSDKRSPNPSVHLIECMIQ